MNKNFSWFSRGILLSILIIFTEAPILGKPWDGIVPLKSTKADVTSRLKRVISKTPDRMEFKTLTGKVVIFFYTSGDAIRLGLNASVAGKVLAIYVYPAKPATYNRQELARKGLKVGHGWTIEREPMTSYDDGEQGISYHFKGDSNKIWRVVYYAPRAEFERIKTGNPADEDDHSN